jgi:endonuclease YncB( thermonuclease family)
MGQIIPLQQPASRPESRSHLIRFAALCAALLLGLALIAYLQRITPVPPAAPPSTGPSAFIVIDGDTIRSPAGVKYRLMGFDAPETYRAQCPEELAIGLKAKVRMEELIASGTARLMEHRLDKYGRTLAVLMIDGKDVAETMIEAGLARPYHGERRQGWCGLGPGR